MVGSQAVDHNFRFRLLRCEGRPPRSQFLHWQHLLLHDALDSWSGNSLQREQAGVGFLAGGFCGVDPWTKPATVPYGARWFWRRGLSTRRTNREAQRFSESDFNGNVAAVGGGKLGSKSSGGLLSQPLLRKKRS